MANNRIRLTETQLHRVIKESVKNILQEYFFYNNFTPEDNKELEMQMDWNNYGSLNRLDSPSDEVSTDEHLGLAAQHKHNSAYRTGARNIKNGTAISGNRAAYDYAKKHGLSRK